MKKRGQQKIGRCGIIFVMKTFFIAIALIAATYAGLKFMPETIKERAENSLGALGVAWASPSRWLPPLEEKAKTLIAKSLPDVIPESPVAKRERLIGELAQAIDTMEKNAGAQTPREKNEFTESATTAAALLKSLEAENPKSGFVIGALERIEKIVLPDQGGNTCAP